MPPEPPTTHSWISMELHILGPSYFPSPRCSDVSLWIWPRKSLHGSLSMTSQLFYHPTLGQLCVPSLPSFSFSQTPSCITWTFIPDSLPSYITLQCSAQTCPTLCNFMDCNQPGSSVHGIFPGVNTGVGCHFLLQGVFPAQGLSLSLHISCTGRQILYH